MNTKAQLEADINLYKEARTKVLEAQEYTIGSRRLRRADLPFIEKTISSLEARLALLERRGKVMSRTVIFGR